jgi:hypothetical protein
VSGLPSIMSGNVCAILERLGLFNGARLPSARLPR